jgi:transposase-like protein
VPSAFHSTNPIFTDETTARAALEALRWPEGSVCPHVSCGATGPAVALISGVKRSHRAGLYRCKTCRGQFTVTVGTIFERSKVPLQDWLRAIHMFSAMQSVTIREVKVELGVTYKTAFQIWKRVCAVLRAYRGHNKGFGRKVQAYISSKRPQSPERLEVWRERNKGLLNGGDGVPKVTGLLASFKLERAPPENLNRTERLLRLLIEADPKLLKAGRKKAAKRSRLNRVAQSRQPC